MRSSRENLRFLDDLARMATGAAGALPGIRAQVKAMVRDSAARVMEEMDLVTRAEFDRVAAMAEKARVRQEELEKRLAALEKKKKKNTTTGKKKKK